MGLELQAAIDDSGKGTPPVFVLAGFVLTAYQWTVFAEHWKAILEAPPKIAYFKMNEASSFSGEFSRINQIQRDEKLAALVKLILEYQPLALSEVMPHELYERIFVGKIARGLDYPYFLAFHEVMGVLWRYQINNNWHPDSKTDFIFDEQGKESDLSLQVWKFTASDAPPELKPLIGNKPSHCDEKKFLPLQAADLYAWHVRRFYSDKSSGINFQSPAWQLLSSLPTARNEWTEERLQKLYDRIRKVGLLFEYDVKSKKELKRHKRTLVDRLKELNSGDNE